VNSSLARPTIKGTNAVAKPFEIIQVNQRSIACDGGDGPLGHPRVFLHMDQTDEITCPYCSRLYKYHESKVDDAAA
jgi:uncharacterized Zn-finger protein